ncbi:unnamed protein product [Thlaspi arvense]|uniref:PLAT domain-containing protein n=1 Tax=Thlaspi arvense TaxID=13288 RepID=A0AAU9SAQ8_THLAR|nr:unnamed protein product [Thlaspi arvense]
MARPNVLLPSLLFMATVSLFAFAEDCDYTIYVRTGTRDSAGTDANVAVVLSDKYGNKVQIPNLENWGGLMGRGHNYFENGNVDVFSSKATCLAGPVCLLSVTSDGTGNKPGWYLDSVEVRVGADSARQHFNVDRWLATDERPYDLTAIRNICGV